MPNFDLPKKEQPPITAPEITQEQLTKSISDIIFQRMTQSEVELMKAENAELKQILASFTENYKKFEDLTNNLIRQNNAEQMKLLNELHRKQEQKLNALNMSNEEVSQKIASTVQNMKCEIEKEVTDIYEKIQKDTAQSLKNYNDSLKSIERQTRQFWTFKGVKEALFWAMCLAVIVMTANTTFDMLGIELDMLWILLYPFTIIAPLIKYGLNVYARKNKK